MRFADMVTSAGATRKARGWTAAAAGIDRYVGLEHLDANSPTIRRWGSPTTVGENSDVRPFEAGDVILARRGIEQRKVGMAEFRGVASGHALVFRARAGVVLSELLPYFLLSNTFMNRALQFSAGSLSKTVNLSALMRQEFALPPLDEQRRISNACAVWLKATEQLREATLGARTVRQSLALKLFGETMAKRRIGEGVKSSAFGPRFSSEGYSDETTANAWTVRTTDFTADGIDLATAPGARLDSDVVMQHVLIPEDVLLSRSGEYAGMVRVFKKPEDDSRAYIPAAFLIRFRLDSGVLLPEFLAAYSESPAGSALVRSLARGSAQPNISGTAFSALEIPMPRVREQQRIVDALSKVRHAERVLEERWQAARGGLSCVLRSVEETA